MRVSEQLPDPARTDAGLVLSSEWVVGSPELLVPTADAVIAAWQRFPWPDGLLTYALFLEADADTNANADTTADGDTDANGDTSADTDGDGVLIRHYSQWTNEAAFESFTRTGRQPRIDLVDAAVPGIVRRDFHRYRLYRGSRSAGGEVPGAIAVVRVGTDDEALAHTWVDAVFEALDQDGDLPAGGLGAFFHVSTDGRQVLNYAEWVSAKAHRSALAASGRGIAQGPLWDKVQTMPGVRHQSVTRFRLHKTLTR